MPVDITNPPQIGGSNTGNIGNTGENQVVIGPDKKYYSFKKERSQDYINKYFQKKGWILGKDGKWLTQSGEKVGDLTKTPPTDTHVASDIVKRKESLDKYGRLSTDVGIAAAGAAPTLFGMVGGMIARTPGAAIGGALGSAIKDLTASSLLEKDPSTRKIVMNMMLQAGIQGGLQKVGDITGEAFFNLLNKMPHVVEVKGIPLLPQDLNPDSKLMTYTTDLLRNLAPSAKTMAEFDAKQSAILTTKAQELANGFAKFNGSTEDLGNLLQKVYRDSDIQYQKTFQTMMANYKKQGFSQQQSERFLTQTKLYKEYTQAFKNKLAQDILKTNKPQLIAGMIASFDKTSAGDTKIFTKTLTELSPETLDKVRSVIIRDAINKTLSGTIDPTAKASTGMMSHFRGETFKDIFDKIGEEKLKALYGSDVYNNAIEPFIKLVGPVGNRNPGAGVGRFLNLVFIMPFRAGMSVKSLGKVTGMGFLANRAAKVITSPEGMKLYENYIRAVGSQSPRIIGLARDEFSAFNEKSDREFEVEQQLAEDEYKEELEKSKAQMRSLDFGTERWRQKQLQ